MTIKRAKRVAVTLTDREYNIMSEAAEVSGENLASFIRRVTLYIANETLADHETRGRK